ncbi:MAG: hypothetical protein KGL39_27375 [Patescibacteria group bacterium]|nr:hypothetical protein [Patescibacteria group bacterium]
MTQTQTGDKTMTTAETRTVKITWIEIETQNAAMVGLDETIESSDTLDEIREAAEYHAECAGVDLTRFQCILDEV